MDNRPKLVGYCRVSTSNQKEEGTIELQETALKEYAEANGYELSKVFKDEAVNGGSLDRPGLAELFNFLEVNEDIGLVAIYKLDRLARDLYLQEHLIKKLEQLGKKLISTKEKDLDSDCPMRKAFRQFMGIVSELEKAFITMRLSGGRINKARKGGHAGGCTPLGYEAKNKDLQTNEDVAVFVRGIFRMRFEFKLTLQEIARILNLKKVPTARGGKWYAGTVRYILNNKIYKGELAYKNELVKREDLALIQT